MPDAVIPLNIELLARGERRERASNLRLSLPALIVVLVLLFVPIGWLMSLSFIGADGGLSLENYTRIWTEGAYVSIFVTTFEVSLWVTLICIILGYPVAYTLNLLPEKISNVLLLAVLIPFWTSLLVRTYAWLVLLQRRGIVNSTLVSFGLIDQPLRLVHNMPGTIIGMVHIMLPFLILPLYASMRAIDGNLLRAASSLGSSPAHAFSHVFLPLSAPGLIAGSMLVFVMSLGFYITPVILGGGRVQMISQRIEASVSLFPTWGPAAALAVVLLILTTGFLLVSWFMVRKLTLANRENS
jgi:ABC-type spermidine/putrescine transport system permease subunit I